MRVMVLGTSFSAVPIYDVLKRLGHEIFVCGGDKNDPLASLCNNHVMIDYSDPEAVYKVMTEEKIDYIVPSCNDASYDTFIYCEDKLDRCVHDNKNITKKLHNKKFFRQLLSELNLPSPKTYTESELNDFESQNFPPVLVKPVDSFSGIGCVRVQNHFELRNAIKFAKTKSKKKEVVLEDFIEGTLHSVSVFIEEKDIKFYFFVDEKCLVNPYAVDFSHYPSFLDKAIQESIILSIQRIIDNLNLSDGLIHMQFLRKENSFWLIEPMRRCPGDLFPHQIYLSCGFNYWLAYVEKFLGRKYSEQSLTKRITPVNRSIIVKDETFCSRSLTLPPNGNKFEVFSLSKSGEIIKETPYGKSFIVFQSFLNDGDNVGLPLDYSNC